ncbi:unnamed protein product [Moneuplotes crassus]|uniref:Uncharacterized protein n=1 Tax=Euplotes crassus TaxID=5936 RepID=A0AAD2D9H7_EUPCR|nr:unnamed protein product [Moneuplotes crassus]
MKTRRTNPHKQKLSNRANPELNCAYSKSGRSRGLLASGAFRSLSSATSSRTLKSQAKFKCLQGKNNEYNDEKTEQSQTRYCRSRVCLQEIQKKQKKNRVTKRNNSLSLRSLERERYIVKSRAPIMSTTDKQELLDGLEHEYSTFNRRTCVDRKKHCINDSIDKFRNLTSLPTEGVLNEFQIFKTKSSSLAPKMKEMYFSVEPGDIKKVLVKKDTQETLDCSKAPNKRSQQAILRYFSVLISSQLPNNNKELPLKEQIEEYTKKCDKKVGRSVNKINKWKSVPSSMVSKLSKHCKTPRATQGGVSSNTKEEWDRVNKLHEDIDKINLSLGLKDSPKIDIPVQKETNEPYNCVENFEIINISKPYKTRKLASSTPGSNKLSFKGPKFHKISYSRKLERPENADKINTILRGSIGKATTSRDCKINDFANSDLTNRDSSHDGTKIFKRTRVHTDYRTASHNRNQEALKSLERNLVKCLSKVKTKKGVVPMKSEYKHKSSFSASKGLNKCQQKVQNTNCISRKQSIHKNLAYNTLDKSKIATSKPKVVTVQLTHDIHPKTATPYLQNSQSSPQAQAPHSNFKATFCRQGDGQNFGILPNVQINLTDEHLGVGQYEKSYSNESRQMDISTCSKTSKEGSEIRKFTILEKIRNRGVYKHALRTNRNTITREKINGLDKDHCKSFNLTQSEINLESADTERVEMNKPYRTPLMSNINIFGNSFSKKTSVSTLQRTPKHVLTKDPQKIATGKIDLKPNTLV